MEKLIVRRPGCTILTIVQVILFVASIGCFIYAITWDAKYEHLRGTFFIYFFALLILGLMVVPFKRVVIAAEYYIARMEKDYTITEPEDEPIPVKDKQN